MPTETYYSITVLTYWLKDRNQCDRIENPETDLQIFRNLHMTNTVSQFGEGELVNSPKIVSYPHGKEIKWHHSQIPGALNKCERKHLKFGKFLRAMG